MLSRMKQTLLRLTLIFSAVSLLFGCAVRIDSSDKPIPVKAPEIPGKVTAPNLIPVNFSAKLRIPASSDMQLAIDILDEVSGMLYNIERYPLIHQADGNFTGTLMLPENATLRYRYVATAPLELAEHKADGSPVGYRIVHVEKNKVIKDNISAWSNAPYSGNTADLTGIVHDRKSNQPLPDVLINIAGYLTYTDMTGRFVLNDLPVGVHMLSAVSIDGSHATFQQQANLVSGLSTPAVIEMVPLPPIKVTLKLAQPSDAVGAPVRISGNYAQTGAIFSEYSQGTFASRMPLMAREEKGDYSIELNLYAGNVFRYKYTLGNGFINAERDQNSELLVRTVTLPNHNVVLNDKITTWRIDGQKPTTIIVRAPDPTPAEDNVSIQFFTNHAHQPIPMWHMDKNRWMFLFFGSSSLGTVTYRFARNDQVELSADPISSANPYRIEYTSDDPQEAIIESWSAWDASQSTPLHAASFPTDRLVGVELIPGFHPSYLSRYRQLPERMKNLGFNWLVLTPSWKVVERSGMPHLEIVPEDSALLTEIAEICALARESGITVALYPQIIFPNNSPGNWWKDSEKNQLWWQQWYNEYERFVMNFSQFANVNGIDQLILGGSGVEFSMPGAIKTNGNNFGTPKTAEQLWTDLLDKVKTYYTGTLLFGIPAEDGKLVTQSFFDKVDGFYLTMSDQDLQPYTYDEYSLGAYLDGAVYAFYDSVDKPLYCGINSASLTSNRVGAESSSGALIRPTDSQYGSANVDLAAQDYFYQVYTPSLAQRDWISGISTRGFFPVLQLTDFSSSVYGKPALNTFIDLTTPNY